MSVDAVSPEVVSPAPAVGDYPDVVRAGVEESAPAPNAATLAAEQTPVVPDPARDESERLNPDPTGPLTLTTGKVVEVLPLKTREMMKLLKIVTRGAGAVLEQLMGELDLSDPAAFAQTLGALIIMSIPEAENEVIEFVQSIVRPYGWDDLAAADRKDAVEQLSVLMAELHNPELDDLISIVERVIRRESEDIRNLGKRIGTAFKLGQKVGLVKPVATS
jgi:hypothetical protein